MPHLINLQRQFGDKGLHIFSFERQNSETDTVIALAKKRRLNYPISAGGAWGYDNDNSTVPHAWLIDINGKVVWEGTPGGNMNQLVKKELEKVKYLGLGRAKVDPAAEKAALFFGQGKLANARTEAQKIIDLNASGEAAASDAALADAKYIIEHVNARRDEMKARAGELKSERYYTKAIAAYGEIQTAFKGAAEDQEATVAIEELKSDEDVKSEIKAMDRLQALLKKIKKFGTAKRRKQLDAFAKKKNNLGTKAAEEALAMK